MKAIIPAAGIGTRLRPQTNTKPKPLISVACKPILGHILDSLAETDINEVAIIVGYMRDILIEYVTREFSDRFDFSFVEQKSRLGLGHAIYCARDHLTKDEPVFIALGDMIFDKPYSEMVKNHYSNDPMSGSIAVKEVDTPQHYGIVFFDEKSGIITKVIEKPSETDSNLAIAGVYIIEDSLNLRFAIETLIKEEIRTLGEYQLTDALSLMIERKTRLKIIESGEWFDCGRKESLLLVNKILLEKFEDNGEPIRNGIMDQTVIIPPVGIERGCKIKNAIIGPYVSIGEEAEIQDSIIRNSIISPGAKISSVVLTDTLIGDSANVKGSFREMNVGDYSSMTL